MSEAKIKIGNYGPQCPCCGESAFDDWWHDPTTRYNGYAIQARLKCPSCSKFFSTTQYPDGVNHSSVGLGRKPPSPA